MFAHPAIAANLKLCKRIIAIEVILQLLILHQRNQSVGKVFLLQVTVEAVRQIMVSLIALRIFILRQLVFHHHLDVSIRESGSLHLFHNSLHFWREFQLARVIVPCQDFLHHFLAWIETAVVFHIKRHRLLHREDGCRIRNHLFCDAEITLRHKSLPDVGTYLIMVILHILCTIFPILLISNRNLIEQFMQLSLILFQFFHTQRPHTFLGYFLQPPVESEALSILFSQLLIAEHVSFKVLNINQRAVSLLLQTFVSKQRGSIWLFFDHLSFIFHFQLEEINGWHLLLIHT